VYLAFKESSPSNGWDEYTTLSKIASAIVLFCKKSYESLTGNWDVIIVEHNWFLASIISNKFVASSAVIADTPKSSRIKSLYLANLLIKFV